MKDGITVLVSVGVLVAVFYFGRSKLPVRLLQCGSDGNGCSTVARFEDIGVCQRYLRYYVSFCDSRDPVHLTCEFRGMPTDHTVTCVP